MFVLDRYEDFAIIDNGTYYTIQNIKGDCFENYHTHIAKKHKGKTTTCMLLIGLICNKRVPNSPYLRTSAKRISRNKKYIQNIENKELKDMSRTYYVNINQGVKRY